MTLVPAIFRVTGLTAVLALAIWLLAPYRGQLRFDPPVESFIAYFATASALTFGFRSRVSPVVIALSVILLGVVIEILQLWVPGRDAEIKDAIISGLGGFLGAFLSSALCGASSQIRLFPPAYKDAALLRDASPFSGLPLHWRSGPTPFTYQPSPASCSPPLFPTDIRIFHTFGDVEDIWRQAQENCACYGFQTFEWLSTWQATIGDAEGIKPHIVQVADRSGNTLMLLPLGIQRRFGLSLLKFLGGDATDYHAPIVRTVFAAALGAAGLDRLMARVMEQLPPVDVIDFEKMPLKIEDATNPLAALPGVEHVHNAHIATLGATFDAFKERRSKKFFRTGDRRWRQLSRIAPVHFCICNANEALTNIISILISQKRRMYWKTGCRDLFDNPRLHRFYTSLAQNNLSTGLIQTSSLCVGETVAAAHIGMVFRGRFYWILPSYDADNWARYSPGRLLMQNLIEWSISSGLKTFDLTIGDEDYKKLWADHTVPLYQFTSGLTVKGKIYLIIRTAGERLRAFARQRPWLAACVRAWRRHKSSSRFR